MDKKIYEESELLGLTKEQLLAIASEEVSEVAFDDNATNEQIIEAILKAQSPSQDKGDSKKKGGKKQGGETGSADDPDPQYPIGAILIKDGKEIVKVAPGDWRPAIRTGETGHPDDKVMVKIRNVSLKGQKVFMSRGTAEFNEDGVAEISAREADRLCKIPGYEYEKA